VYDEEGNIMKPDGCMFCSCNGSAVTWGYWGKAFVNIQCLACFGTGGIPYVGHAPFGYINHV